MSLRELWQLVEELRGLVEELAKRLEIELIRDSAGLDAAHRRAKRTGRPRREFDLDQARKMLEGGGSIALTAARLGVSVRTLRRYVPAVRVVQPAIDDTQVGETAGAEGSET